MKICQICGKTLINGSGLSAHMRAAHKNPTTTPLGETPRFAATLFSVLDGDIHIRGCEFNGGFLVIDGDRIAQYATLHEALAEAKAAQAAEKREDSLALDMK